MPPCRGSPWCECGTRYDGRRIIFCDKHPPRNVLETHLASEIYVNGDRWSLDESTDTERTQTQQAENDLAQAILHPTPSSAQIQDNVEHTVHDTFTQAPQDSDDIMDFTRDSDFSFPSDLADVEVDSDLVGDAPVMSHASELDQFEEDFPVNSDNNDDDVELYQTPPNSPIDNIQFFSNQTTNDDIEEFEGDVRKNLLTSVQHDFHPNITAIQWVPPPAPRQGQLLINQSTGN